MTGTNENRVGRIFKELAPGVELTCTASFVGGSQSRFFVSTSSHCLFTAQGNAVFGAFVPRQDRCVTATGVAMPAGSCQERPFGTWPQNGARMHYSAWLNDCRYNYMLWNTPYCIARDIAVAEVSRPSGVAFPGANGFGVWSTTSNPTIAHRGYPLCYSPQQIINAPDGYAGSVQLPNVCRFRTSYGRDNGSWGEPFQGGLGMAASFSMSQGHSGGPLWTSSSGTKVLAVVSAGYVDCKPFGSVNCALPAAAARITDPFYSWMLTFMGL